MVYDFLLPVVQRVLPLLHSLEILSCLRCVVGIALYANETYNRIMVEGIFRTC